MPPGYPGRSKIPLPPFLTPTRRAPISSLCDFCHGGTLGEYSPLRDRSIFARASPKILENYQEIPRLIRGATNAALCRAFGIFRTN